MPAQLPTQHLMFIVFISAGALRSLIRLQWQLRPLISQQKHPMAAVWLVLLTGQQTEQELRAGPGWIDNEHLQNFSLCSVSDLPPAFRGDVLCMFY